MHFLTSRNSFPAVLILTLTLLVSAQAELSQEKEESHRFYNTDKTKSFLGVLKSYSPSKKSVGVRLENGRIQFLGIKHLSEEDQAYVLGQSKRLAILNRVRASAEKFSESSTKKEGSGVEERIYPTGYRITVDNGSEETFDQLVVNYTLYYGVQSYESSSRDTKTKTGNLTFRKLEPRKRLTLDTSTVDIISGKKVQKSKNNKKGKNNKKSSSSKRRKDVIYGCKIDLMLDGKVIKSFTEGSIKD